VFPCSRPRRNKARDAVPLAGAAAALLWIFSAAAFAQEDSSEVRLLGINSLHGSVELQGLYQSQDVTDKQAQSESLALEESFTEIMTLSMDGFIYHPRFLTFSGSVGLNLLQGEEQVQTSVQNQSGSLSEVAPQYSISGVLLGQHRVSLGFAFNKSTSTASLPFQPLMTTNDENQQLTLSVKSATLPTQFLFSHDDSSQKEFGFGEDINEDITIAGMNTRHATDRSTTIFSYQYLQDLEEEEEVSTVTTQTATQRYVQDAEFSNILRLGDKDWATLTSRASLRDEAGSFPSDLFMVDESLLLKHAPNLSSQYGIDYSRTTVAGQETDLTALQASLTHQLYQSLTSTARVYGSYETIAGTTDETYGFSLSEDYRKKLPWGTLTVNLGGGYLITDEETQPGIVSIVRESQTLSDTSVTFLNNPNVVIGSVVVTNSAGLHTYFLNADYELIPRGILTEIRRVPTGGIANGASVLVNYQYQNDLPIEYSTRDLHGRIQLDLFDHLSLYAYRLSLPETLISGVNEGQLQSLEETLLGATIRWKPATLTGEHEIYDSTLVPYTSDRVSFDVAWPVAENQQLGANATYHHVAFQVTGQGSETLRNVGLTYQATPRKWPSINASAGYEWDSGQGLSSQYAYGRVRFDYRIRNTTFALDIEINQENDPSAKQLFEYVFFSIKRDLF